MTCARSAFILMLAACAWAPGCQDALDAAKPTITFGRGEAIRCLDGVGCPSECACEAPVGLAACRLPSGDACVHGGVGLGDARGTYASLDGEWREGWTCVDRIGSGGARSDVRTTVLQDGAVLTIERGIEPLPFEGALVGRDLVWTRSTETFRETGVISFVTANAFTSSAIWQSLDGYFGGHCVGEGQRAPR